jgi:hypothetical protein
MLRKGSGRGETARIGFSRFAAAGYFFFFFAAFFLAGFFAAFLAFFAAFLAIASLPLWRRARLPAARWSQLQPDVEPQFMHL